MDAGRGDCVVRARNAITSTQPRHRAGTTGRVGAESDRCAETQAGDKADLWVGETQVDGKEGAGGSEEVAGEGGGVKTYISRLSFYS